MKTAFTIGIAILAIGPYKTLSTELNCANPERSGTFTRVTDCTLSKEIDLLGDMEISGKDKSLTTITSASTSRHFKITGSQKLTLKFLKLKGGFRSM